MGLGGLAPTGSVDFGESRRQQRANAYYSGMRASVCVGDVVSAIAARVGADGSSVVNLLSLVALLAVGGAAAHMARRLISRSTPELAVLLDQSAAFYARWPEDRLANAPRAELVAEATRTGRIMHLLQQQSATRGDDGPASRGPLDGLQAWIAVLGKRIEQAAEQPAGASYA